MLLFLIFLCLTLTSRLAQLEVLPNNTAIDWSQQIKPSILNENLVETNAEVGRLSTTSSKTLGATSRTSTQEQEPEPPAMIDWSQVEPSILNLWQSSPVKHRVPQKVSESFRKVAPEYTRYLADDADIRNFFEIFGYAAMIKKFDALEHPAHKADFFRYGVLYHFGGVWVDEDMMPLADFSEIFAGRQDTFYTAASYSAGVFQAVISVPAKWELMRSAFLDFARTPNKKLHGRNRPTAMLSTLLQRRLPVPFEKGSKGSRPPPLKNMSYDIQAGGFSRDEEPWGPMMPSPAITGTRDPGVTSPRQVYNVYLFEEKCQKKTDGRRGARNVVCCELDESCVTVVCRGVKGSLGQSSSERELSLWCGCIV